MKKRSAAEIRLAMNRALKTIEEADEATERMEELRKELAHTNPTYFLLLCKRVIPETTNGTPDAWDYEVLPVSREVAYRKQELGFQANKSAVEIHIHSDKTYLLTIFVSPNERIQFSLPFYSCHTEVEFMFYAFSKKAEAEECLNVLQREEPCTEDLSLN